MKNSLLDVAVRKSEAERKRMQSQCTKGFLDMLLTDLKSNGVLAEATPDTICNRKLEKKGKLPALQVTPTIHPPANDDDADDAVAVTPSPTNRGRRPKGLSNEAKLLQKQACEMAMEAATKQCQKEMAAASNGKLPKGQLQAIVNDTMKNC